MWLMWMLNVYQKKNSLIAIKRKVESIEDEADELHEGDVMEGNQGVEVVNYLAAITFIMNKILPICCYSMATLAESFEGLLQLCLLLYLSFTANCFAYFHAEWDFSYIKK